MLLFCPQTQAAFAEFMQWALLHLDLGRPPIDGQLSKPVDQTFLLDHAYVTLPPLLLFSVMIPHRPAHLLIVHLL